MHGWMSAFNWPQRNSYYTTYDRPLYFTLDEKKVLFVYTAIDACKKMELYFPHVVFLPFLAYIFKDIYDIRTTTFAHLDLKLVVSPSLLDIL